MLDIFLGLAVVASTGFTILLLCAPTRYIRHSPPKSISNEKDASHHEPKVSVQVLVLGDIGRSPRMQYHAMSIAKHGGRVDMIGYNESPLHPGLIHNDLVSIVPLSLPPSLISTLQRNGAPFILIGPLKVLWQIWNLFYVLGYRTRPARWLFVQNPPSIPTLFVSFIICFLRNTHLIIDWHNYGWTILAGTKGVSHPFVRISKAYESFFGRWAPTLSITVTEAMARQLHGPPYYIQSPILTLHDRPAATFQPIESASERQAFLSRLPETKPYAEQIITGKARLLVSSTSWTPDEDFSLLLDALVSYSAARTQSQDKPATSSLPPILAIITGKGPQKEHYISLIASLTSSNKLNGITILTAWLLTMDYALLLACADLGVSLHKSSSGVDLPMKVVDMFGAGLPVVGYAAYESWPELVREGVNGRGFETSDELRAILCELFEEKGKGKGKVGGVGTAGAKLELLRFGAIEEGRRRWDDEWDGIVGRVLGLCE